MAQLAPGHLHEKARLGDFEGCLRLLDAGVAVDQTHNGETALLEACREGHIRVATLLLQRGANPNASTQWEHPLTVLPWGYRRTLHLAQQLRNAGADLTHLPHARVVSQRISARAMGLLLDWGLDANAVDDDGYSRLYWAAKDDQGRICEFLLQYGAQANRCMPDGRYAWECSSDIGLRKLLREACQQHEADQVAEDISQNTVATGKAHRAARL